MDNRIIRYLALQIWSLSCWTTVAVASRGKLFLRYPTLGRDHD